MTKSLMISIQPQHAVNILNGDKTLELRTWIPKGYVGWVYAYVTKVAKDFLYKYKDEDEYYTQRYLTFTDSIEILNGKVAFRFWFDEYETLEKDWDLEISTDKISNEKLLEKSCVDYNTLNNMFMNENGDVFGYAWHIKKLEIFDEPKKLSDFYKRIDGLDEDGGFILNTLKDGEYVTIKELKEKYLLSKAPQKSVWVYTKELENEII